MGSNFQDDRINMKEILFLPYFGNIEFYSILKSCESPIFEIWDTYPKQTFRNRTQILGANGILDLSIPIKKPKGSKSKTCEIEIDYSENWQKIHLKSLESAYKNSPYFDYYANNIFDLIEQNDTLLIEKNKNILQVTSQLIGISTEIKTSEDYIKNEGAKDFRTSISPKIKSNFKHNNWIQVFADRFEFQPNLSILDLLFNEGPNTVNFLN